MIFSSCNVNIYLFLCVFFNSIELEMHPYLMLNVSVHSLQHALTSVLVWYKGFHLCKQTNAKSHIYNLCSKHMLFT